MDLCVNDFVRLTNDIPDMALRTGTVGVVRSLWFPPSRTYEVEFHSVGGSSPIRVLVTGEQVQPCRGRLDERLPGGA